MIMRGRCPVNTSVRDSQTNNRVRGFEARGSAGVVFDAVNPGHTITVPNGANGYVFNSNTPDYALNPNSTPLNGVDFKSGDTTIVQTLYDLGRDELSFDFLFVVQGNPGNIDWTILGEFWLLDQAPGGIVLDQIVLTGFSQNTSDELRITKPLSLPGVPVQLDTIFSIKHNGGASIVLEMHQATIRHILRGNAAIVTL